jgi:hypothetical protein
MRAPARAICGQLVEDRGHLAASIGRRRPAIPAPAEFFGGLSPASTKLSVIDSPSPSMTAAHAERPNERTAPRASRETYLLTTAGRPVLPWSSTARAAT